MKLWAGVNTANMSGSRADDAAQDGGRDDR